MNAPYRAPTEKNIARRSTMLNVKKTKKIHLAVLLLLSVSSLRAPKVSASQQQQQQQQQSPWADNYNRADSPFGKTTGNGFPFETFKPQHAFLGTTTSSSSSSNKKKQPQNILVAPKMGCRLCQTGGRGTFS